MSLDSRIVTSAKAYAGELLQNEVPASCTYHNYEHTLRVVNAFIEIGKGINLSDEDMALGTLASWFHDTGHTVSCAHHEAESVKIAKRFLEEHHASKKDIEAVTELIMSTKLPQQPKTIVGKVLCDADLHHLGSSDFFDISNNLKVERQKIDGRTIDDDEWNRTSYFFIKDHRYFTSFAQDRYGQGKEHNLKILRKGIKEFNRLDKEIKSLEAKISKLTAKVALKPERGIETMFRTTSKNHLTLSEMADKKANIMISVNTLLASVLVSFTVKQIPDHPNMAIPVLSLVLVCLVTIVLSILATRPNVSKGKFTVDDIKSKKTNLLFFGNFHGMSVEEYEWGMKEMMQDADYLYGSLTRDIFFLGKVLGKKYKMLRAAYTTFMIGFVVCILLFIVFMLWLPEDAIYYL